MCFNSPVIVATVKDRAGVIGAEIAEQLAALKREGKEHLFAGIIAGWETQIGRDFETDRPLGYRALSHRGFSADHPPKDADAEWVQVVREFIELWANSLHAAGVPKEKIFCHIAFTAQGLRAPDARESYAVKVHFAAPEVAFDPAYRRDSPPILKERHSRKSTPPWRRTLLRVGFRRRARTSHRQACPVSQRWRPIWAACSITAQCW